ncbi:MAG: type ISP restriction/modification enzyme, partial [Ginsengibacter sp.]
NSNRILYRAGLHFSTRPDFFRKMNTLVTNFENMNDLKKESNSIQTNKIFGSYDGNFAEPLYLYPATNNNLEPELIKTFEHNLSLTFTKEKEVLSEGEVCFMNSPEVRPEFRVSFATIDILDYLYAFLYLSSYREKYNKIGFPEVPFPTDTSIFWKLVALGSELRQIHLLECSLVEKLITNYPVGGNNLINQINYSGNKVFINETQYFDNVPQIAWNFKIGSFQPAQKWLKDRKEKEISLKEISLYQKIIVALKETNRIMNEVDKISIE